MTALRPELAGTGVLLRFALRRDRIRLPVWIVVAAALVGEQSAASQAFYDTPQALAAYRATVGTNPATIALSGPPVGLYTVAGAVAFEISFSVILVAALMAMFTTVRHTRTDEEAGRTELLRAGGVGRHAPLAAAVALSALGCLGMAAAIAAAAAGTGLPGQGSLLLGASVGAAGLVFTGPTAVAVQVSAAARATYGLVMGVFLLAFGIRAIGDIQGNGVSWASPIGWAQATHPYSEDRAWPLLLCVLGTVVLLAGATALLDHRDLGAGLLAPRPGAAAAPRSLLSPLGLAWRLQRGAVAGWGVGLVVLGALYGGLGNSVERLLADNSAAQSFFPDAARAGLVNAYLAATLVVCALVATAFGVAAALRAHGEEAAGRVEPVLATATGRAAWLGSHATVALAGSAGLLAAAGLAMGAARAVTTGDIGDLAGLLGASLAHLPAVWLMTGLAVALAGSAPRAAVPTAWALFAVVVVVTLFAQALSWPRWVQDLSPLTWTPDLPAEEWTAGAGAALLVGALALVVLGFAGMRRRDLTTG